MAFLHGERRTYQIIPPPICHRCASWGICTQAKHGRAIVKLIDEAVKQQFEAQYAKPESPAICRWRKARAELPFGHMKWNLGVPSFLLRGLSGVRAEAEPPGNWLQHDAGDQAPGRAGARAGLGNGIKRRRRLFGPPRREAGKHGSNTLDAVIV